MRTLLTLTDSDIWSGTTNINHASLSHRKAARAVVVDKQGRIALLNVSKYNYHKLPGGGIEENENVAQALQRELLEEIGCNVEVTDEIGEIIEFYNKQQMKQTSYCFSATKTSEQKLPAFTPEEVADGFEMLWVRDINAAITLLYNDKPMNYNGMFIQKRDLTFLRAAKSSLQPSQAS